MDKVITVSRQFGSGGREFGKKLAAALNIPFYDKDLISLAAKDSAMCEEFMTHHEESAPNMLSSVFYSAYFMPMSDQIYIAQSNVIKMLAKQGPCVILGRCADAILEDSVKIYVHADLAKRVEPRPLPRQRARRSGRLRRDDARVPQTSAITGAPRALRQRRKSLATAFLRKSQNRENTPIFCCKSVDIAAEA